MEPAKLTINDPQQTRDQLKNTVQVNILPNPQLIPFDIYNGLSQYSKVYICKNVNKFRNFHCLEPSIILQDYMVYGELPDGDKKLLFTVKKHFECCKCCDSCIIHCACCCDYVCCNKILYQMDYKRNDTNFFTQGRYYVKGCYFCKCLMCNCCNEPLYLRENSQPDNPDYNVGVKKGTTVSNKSCFSCQDKTVVYYSETGEKGHTLRLDCCELLKLSIPCFCTRCKDINISIENKDGLVVGNILVPNGFCSAKVDSMCQVPGTYFEINFPQNIPALEKFQIITEAVHYDQEYLILL